MKLIGKVIKFDGIFGVIESDDKNIEFEYRDISYEQDINVGDTVEFRLEEKDYDVLLARNVNKINGGNIMKYNGLDIEVYLNVEESNKHLEEDFNALMQIDVNDLVKGKFMDWLLGSDFIDRDRDLVFEGLKLYEVNYHYGKIVAQYSPTGEDNYFGQFEFCFESNSEYTDDILQAVAMQVYMLDGKVVKVSGYDI